MPDVDRFELVFVVVPAVLVIAGLVIVGSGIHSIVVARRFLRIAEEVPGMVSGHRYRVHRHTDSDDRVVTVPVLRFTTRKGQRVETEQAIALGGRVPERGTEVTVLYDPALPGRAAMVGTTNGATPDAVIRILFGAVFVLFASNFLHPWIFTLSP
jgi:Protein of unknown function (DUF3592)